MPEDNKANIKWENSKVERVHDTDKIKELLKSKGPCMVIIYADWCGHCQASESAWTKLANMVDGEAAVYVIEEKEYKGGDVSSFPTIKIVKDGVATDYTDARTPENMKNALLGTTGGKRSRRGRTRRFRNRRRKTHRSTR